MLGHSETSIAVCICRIARARAIIINIVIEVTMQASLAVFVFGVYIHVCGNMSSSALNSVLCSALGQLGGSDSARLRHGRRGCSLSSCLSDGEI